MASDADLVARIAERDRAALASLYDRHASTVLALAVRILRHKPDAEEVLGDVFWELWSNPARFDATRATLVGYLLTLARSRAIDRVRARRRVEARQLPQDDLASNEPVAQAPTPLATAVEAERGRRIRAALGRLSGDQRQAIELAFYSGLSHNEVATELKQPLGTVKSRIRQGLIQLREELRSAFGGGVGP
jgi:RNA polymerase sigma-70 factor, ECF subfamily